MLNKILEVARLLILSATNAQLYGAFFHTCLLPFNNTTLALHCTALWFLDRDPPFSYFQHSSTYLFLLLFSKYGQMKFPFKFRPVAA